MDLRSWRVKFSRSWFDLTIIQKKKKNGAGMRKMRRTAKSLNGRKHSGVRRISILLCHYPFLSHGWLINLNPCNTISKYGVVFWFGNHNLQFVVIFLSYGYRKIACLTFVSVILFSWFKISKLIIDNQSLKDLVVGSVHMSKECRWS